MSALDLINVNEIDKYLKTLLENQHIQKMQISYVRAKIESISKSKIEKLVEVNLYTSGLKTLMYAFIESDNLRAKQLYECAINQLVHIKYYHVEAIYLFSKFLLKNNSSDFNIIVSNGLTLAKKHYYRYLQYQFEQLINPTEIKYSIEKYPLPSRLDTEISKKVLTLTKSNLK